MANDISLNKQVSDGDTAVEVKNYGLVPSFKSAPYPGSSTPIKAKAYCDDSGFQVGVWEGHNEIEGVGSSVQLAWVDWVNPTWPNALLVSLKVSVANVTDDQVANPERIKFDITNAYNWTRSSVGPTGTGVWDADQTNDLLPVTLNFPDPCVNETSYASCVNLTRADRKAFYFQIDEVVVVPAKVTNGA